MDPRGIHYMKKLDGNHSSNHSSRNQQLNLA